MTTKQIMDRVLDFIQELTAFYGELSQELPPIKIIDCVSIKKNLKKTILEN